MADYYNYNNVKFVMDNQPILVDNATFSVNATLSPKELIDKRGGFDYTADAGQTSTLSVGYFLTGADPLRPFLESENSIPVEAAGLTLQKGYLNSYSISASPFGPVQVQAGLNFYEDFDGTFSPTVLAEADYDYLQFSDMSVSLQGVDSTSKIKALTYSFSCEMEPIYKAGGAGADAVYRAGDLVPEEIRFKKKTTSLSIQTYNFQEALSYVGKDVTIDFTIGPESFQAKGKLSSKSVSFSFGQKLMADFSLTTDSYGGAPSLHASNTGGSKEAGDLWHIYGDNLLDTTVIYFNNNVKVNKFSVLPYTGGDSGVIGNTEIKITVPRFARSGPIRVITPHGEAAHQQAAGMASIDANIISTYVP
jgi:hypothetical protein